MAKSSSNSRKRGKPKDTNRRGKKKISPLLTESVEYVDYKDVDLLKRFMSDRAKIRSRRVSGNDSQQQRQVARAIKNAREMGLLPYSSRVTTPRRGANRGRDDRNSNSDESSGRKNDQKSAPSDSGDSAEKVEVDA